MVAGEQDSVGRREVEGEKVEKSLVWLRRVYSRLLEPAEHPDDDRRAVKPPTLSSYGPV
jgi:hypothetical protein